MFPLPPAVNPVPSVILVPAEVLSLPLGPGLESLGPQKHISNPSSTPAPRTCTRTRISILTKSFQGGWLSGQSVANLHLVSLSLRTVKRAMMPVPKVLGSNPRSPLSSLFASVVVTSLSWASWDTSLFARPSRTRFWGSFPSSFCLQGHHYPAGPRWTRLLFLVHQRQRPSKQTDISMRHHQRLEVGTSNLSRKIPNC